MHQNKILVSGAKLVAAVVFSAIMAGSAVADMAAMNFSSLGRAAERTHPEKTVTPPPEVPTRSRYDKLIAKHAAANGVPLPLAHAVIEVESTYRPDARGSSGEVGLMQIMPRTARDIGYKGTIKALYNPDTNLRWGMKYLGEAYRRGGKSICGTVMKYNAGHYAKRHNSRTRTYCAKVKRIMGPSARDA